MGKMIVTVVGMHCRTATSAAYALCMLVVLRGYTPGSLLMIMCCMLTSGHMRAAIRVYEACTAYLQTCFRPYCPYRS